ncbi:MAG: molybdate ABC transporter substrate-binding protein [Solirubrobacterales bacterium]
MGNYVVACFAALALAGCGSGGDAAPLTVSAAASLTDAFEAYGKALPGEQRFSFGGSDALAAQIRQGAEPDVYAAANTAYPEQLAAAGLVEEPVVFARNQLVIAAPPGSEIGSLADLAAPGLDLVVCAAGVPCGDYTRELLDRLPAAERQAILANVRSEEADVKGVVGKIAEGAADAGFVYSSDAAAAAGRVEAVALPARLEPTVAYGAAVVAGAAEPAAAEEFVAGLLDGPGAEALAAAGFLPPP